MRDLLYHLFLVAICLADDPRPRDDSLGAKPPAGAVVLFDGTDLARWVKAHRTTPAEWPVVDGVVTVAPGKGGIQSRDAFGDFQLHIEFNVPYMPTQKGQGRGNSGVFLGGIYELQVLDSYGLKLNSDDCGAIYKQVIPSVNACKPPLQWQTYDVTFRKARVENGKVVARARVTVLQNSIKTIDDAEIDPTAGGADNAEGEPGPLLLQDHHNEVQFRNIWLKPL
jgi:hypothetical protein